MFYALGFNENVGQAPVVKTLQWWRKRNMIDDRREIGVLIAALSQRSSMIEIDERVNDRTVKICLPW